MSTKTENLEDRVKEIIAGQLLEDVENISREDNFVEDLGADSLDTVEMIMEFEDEFRIKIPDEDAESITTVGEAIDYLKNVLEEQ